MKNECNNLHKCVNKRQLFSFPFDTTQIPLNGIYILFENGEHGHSNKRIVRIGTHTGQGQLRSRLKQHFVTENKDRSIFRKNIGRCILNRTNDPFLKQWELDLTSKKSRNKYSKSIDLNKQKKVEEEVSKYIKTNFSFVIIEVSTKQKRLALESKIISTVSLCEKCRPSKEWLGLYSPKEKIQESGLWLVNELYKKPLSEKDFEYLNR